MSEKFPHEVFLSHSNQDRGFVDELANELNRHGVRVWYSPTDIMGGQQWHDEIGSALRRCDWFVIVLSPRSVESPWVKSELMYVFRHNRLRDRVIPLLYEACDFEELSWKLPEFQMIDFRDNSEDGLKHLLRVWGLGYKGAQGFN
jgi:hypothetical protein